MGHRGKLCLGRTSGKPTCSSKAGLTSKVPALHTCFPGASTQEPVSGSPAPFPWKLLTPLSHYHRFFPASPAPHLTGTFWTSEGSCSSLPVDPFTCPPPTAFRPPTLLNIASLKLLVSLDSMLCIWSPTLPPFHPLGPFRLLEQNHQRHGFLAVLGGWKSRMPAGLGSREDPPSGLQASQLLTLASQERQGKGAPEMLLEGD